MCAGPDAHAFTTPIVTLTYPHTPHCSLAELEADIVGLINTRELAARLNADRKVLESHKADVRGAAVAAARSVAARFGEEARALLLSTSMRRQGMHKDKAAGGARAAAGGSGGVMVGGGGPA